MIQPIGAACEPVPMWPYERALKALYERTRIELGFEPELAGPDGFTRLRNRMLPGMDAILAGQPFHRHPAYSSEQLLSLTDLDLAPLIANQVRYAPMPWHANGYFEWVLALSGHCVYYVGDRTVPLSAGDVLLLPPGVRFTFLNTCERSRVVSLALRASTLGGSLYALMACPGALPEFLRRTRRAELPIAYLRLSTGDPAALGGLARALGELAKGDSPTRRPRINALALEFFSALTELPEEDTQAVLAHTSADAGERMIAYVRTHFQRLTRAELAEQFNYSERQVTRLLRERAGMSFAQLLCQTRLEYVANTLATTDLPVQAIVEASGYGYNSHFYGLFRERFGMAPIDYRQRLREGLPAEIR